MSRQDQSFRGFVEQAPIGIYRTSLDGLVIMANPALVAILCFDSFEELAERNLTRTGFDPPDARREFLDRMLRDGRIREHPATWLRRDGSRLHILESAWEVRDVDGQVIGFEGTVEDITARVRAEDERRESELRYRQLIEALPHGVAIVQHERIVFANPTIARMLRLESPEQLIGAPSDFALAEEDRARVVPQLWQALEDDGPWPFRFFSTSQRPDGTRFPSEIFCSRITYGQESALHLVHNQLRYRANVICELEPLPPLVAMKGKLSQVLLNILLNAAQALEQGKPERQWVRVKTGRDGGQVFVEIANNGVPIPEDWYPRSNRSMDGASTIVSR